MKKKAEWTTSIPLLTNSAASVFWSHVWREEESKCWLWSAALYKDGYGNHRLKFDDNVYRCRKASRLAWAFTNDRWPGQNEVVMHTCDNRKCCNPKHLRLGTNNENMKDMADKGRASSGDGHYSRTNPEKLARGSRVASSKLKEHQVARIKWMLLQTPKPSLQSIADEYGMSKSLIWSISKGEWWKDVAPKEF